MGKPKIRFKGYTDEWEQRKFGDLGSVSMCKRIFKEQTSTEGDIPFYKIGTFGGEPDAFISKELFEEYKDKFPYPEVGDMLISASGTIGRTVEYKGENAYFQDSNIVWFKHADRVDNSFLKCIYSVVKWSGIEGSTIKRLYNDNFLKTEFTLPQIEEQKKIGGYFNILDHLITLHQRKYEQAKTLKKYMLQKMFPQDGMRVPEIRFAGFTDEWEQRKLGGLVKNVAKKNKDNLDLESYAVTNDRGFIVQKDAHDDFGYMSSVDRTAYNIVPPNSFAYNPARINVGSLGYYEGAENVIVSSLYEVFQTVENIDDKFLLQWFKSDAFPRWIEKFQEGSVRLYFYFDKLVQCQMMVPSLEEQNE